MAVNCFEQAVQQYFENRQKVVDEIVQFCLDNQQLPYREIGVKFGISAQLARYYARRAGIRRPTGRKPKGQQ